MTTSRFNVVTDHSYESVFQLEGRDILVTANAGSGKTRLLVERYLHLLAKGAHPRSIIAFTFTEKAARQLKERILEALHRHPEFAKLPNDILGDWREQIHRSTIGTIHQFCLRILRESTALNNLFQGKIIDEAAEINLRESQLNATLENCFNTRHWTTELLLPRYGMPQLRDAVRAVLALRPSNTPLEEDPEIPSMDPEESRLFEALGALAQEIQEQIDLEKKRHQWLSFDDLERKALEELKAPGEPTRGFLHPLQHLLVDEFQDTSPTQISLIKALQDFKTAQKQPLYIFAVGDPKQSIYRFRNVDRLLIERTQGEILQRGGEAFALPRNFRSLPPLVDFTNHFSEKAFPGEPLSRAEKAAHPSGRVGLFVLQTGEDHPSRLTQQETEARWIAGKIMETHRRGRPWDQIAVLFRAAASALPLIDRLKEFEIPFTLRGGRNLYDRQEILDLKNLLYFLNEPDQNLYFIGILRSPCFQISDAALFYMAQGMERGESLFKRFKGLSKIELAETMDASLAAEIPKILWAMDQLQQWLDQVPVSSPYALLRSIVQAMDLRRLYGEIGGDWDAPLAVEQFLVWMNILESELDGATLKEIVKVLKQLGKTPSVKAPLGDLLEGNGCVHLLTMHSAKGLEFPTVFIMDLARSFPAKTQGILSEGGRCALRIPDPLAEGKETERFAFLKERQRLEDLEENKRLLYVALTRAEEELIIPLSENPRGKNNLQSVLLDHLDPSYLKSQVGEETPAAVMSDSPLPRPQAAPPRPEEQALNPHACGPTLTVSQLETFIQCPVKFYLAHQTGLSDQVWNLPGKPDHTVLGTLLHKALNVLQTFPEKNPGDLLRYLLQTEPLWDREDLLSSLTNSLEKYLVSDAYRVISESEEDYSELPFLLKMREGFLRGQIDRLVKNGNQWHLIDFKFTLKKSSPEQIQKTYGFQLKTYALAARRILNGTIPKLEIHLLGRQEAHPLDLGEAELNAHERFLEGKITEWRRPILEEVKIHEACFSCPFHRSIPVCPVPKGRSLFSLHGSPSFDLMKG